MASKHPISWAIALSLVFFGTTIFSIDLLNALWILAFVPIIIIALIAVTFSWRMTYMAFKRQKLIYWQALFIIIFSCLTSLSYREPLSRDVRFFLLRPYYENQLAQIQAGESIPEVKKEDALIAFYWYRGVVDNWVGLVYDPRESLSLPKSAKIFGGEVTYIYHLHNGWFLCYFS